MSKIKVFHTADLHLGIESYGKVDPSTQANTRIQDFFVSLDWLIDKAIKEDIDALIIAGDIYHHREPSIFVQNEFSKRLNLLVSKQIPVILLIGNHDSILSMERISSLQIFKELNVPLIYLFDEAKVITIETKHGPLQIAGIPFLERNMIREFMINRNIEESRRNEIAQLVITRLIGGFKKEVKAKIPTILTAHLTIREAMYDNWRPTIVGNEIYISKSVLIDPIFSYVAMGHIHKAQLFEGDKTEPSLSYPGSLIALDFGEASYDHGFMCIEFDILKNKTLTKFIKIPNQRRFITFNLDINPEDDLFIKCKELFDSSDYLEDIVRINIALHGEAEVDEQKIRRDFSERCHLISSIHIDRKKRIMSRISTLSSDLEPMEALQQYIKASDDTFLLENQKDLTLLVQQLIDELGHT
jgi:DNA repair protein SbcD/Mre11